MESRTCREIKAFALQVKRVASCCGVFPRQETAGSLQPGQKPQVTCRHQFATMFLGTRRQFAYRIYRSPLLPQAFRIAVRLERNYFEIAGSEVMLAMARIGPPFAGFAARICEVPEFYITTDDTIASDEPYRRQSNHI
jgi:hypothetical protein